MSEEHHDHSKHYIKLYWLLMALFLVSCLGPEVGERLGAPWITLVTAFGIAGVKAYIVIAYFMHLKGEKQFVIYLLTASVGLMFLFYFAVAPDVHNHEGRNWVNTSAMASVTDGFCTAFDDCSHHAKEGDEACEHGGLEENDAARDAHIEARHAEHASHGESHGESHGKEDAGH